MSFEKRLRDHLAEQAAAIEIDAAEPAAITDQGPRRSHGALTTIAAVLVVLAAGAGFWVLSSDDGEVTEIAAGDPDDADAGTSAGPDEADGAATALETIDITSESSPGFGRVFSDGGIYYVLSTAPGRVDLSTVDEEDFPEIYRQNTIYSYADGQGWTISDVDDRFISDFDVDDGVLYVVSTGSAVGAGAAIGSSTDQGRTWSWTPIDGLPEVHQLAMLVGDEQMLVFASRWGFPDYQQVLDAARDGGVDVSDVTLRDFDHEGFSYVPLDPDDRCAAVLAMFAPELLDFNSWIAEAPESERATAEAEYQSMLQWMREEIEGNGCELPPDWEDTVSAQQFDFPEPIRVSWSDIGFTVPDTWRAWSTAYTFDGERFTDVGTPFADDGVEVGYVDTAGDRLTVSVYDPRGMEEGEEGETLWFTTDGANWEQEFRRFDEEHHGYYGPGWVEPTAGNKTFRIWWEEHEGEAFAEDVVATRSTVADDLTAGAAQEETAITIEANGEARFEEEGYYEEPEPLLQQSVAGGPWQTVTLAELAPGLDVGERMLHDVRGTSLGAFLIYGEPFSYDGPPAPGLTVVHSSNGVDWAMFELDGNGIEVHNGDGEVLVFSHDWSREEGEQSTTQAVLVRPAG